MSGLKVTRETPTTPLPTSLESPADPDGDSIDWPTGPGTALPLDGLSNVDTTGKADGDTIIWDDASDTWIAGPGGSTGDFELKNEGGQSFIQAHGSMGATETIDPTDGNVHTGILDADVTYTLNAPVGTGAAEIEFERTASGGPWTETWPGTVTWMGGSPPTPPTSGDSAIVILRSLDGGSSWLGIAIGSGGGGGTPATTVTDETTFGITPAVGTDTEYARQDHTHGSPDDPVAEGMAHYEVLMDGGSPPEPLEDGSGTDWLYVWVA